MNAVQALVKQIEVAASKKGLHFHRFQSNKSGHKVVISYGFHNSPIKPSHAASLSGKVIILTAREGTTAKCEAFRKLSDLAASL